MINPMIPVNATYSVLEDR